MKPNRDISKYIRNRFIKLIAEMLLWNILLAVLEKIFIYDYFKTTLNELNAVVFWIASAIIPFFFFKGHKLVFGFGWEGTLKKIEYTDNNDTSLSSVGNLHGQKRSMTVLMTVVKDNGRTVSVKIDNGESHREYEYKVGDRLKFHYGTHFPIILGGIHDICPICGHENEKTDSHCNFCEREVLHS